MNGAPTPLLVLDLLGTFAFALNGGLTAVRVARVDIVGVLTLGMITAMGGGIIRDVLLGDVPPATFRDWRYLAVAAAGALIAFAFSWLLNRLTMPIEILDAVGLSVFAVTGASKAIEFGLGPAQAIILGTITAVGGGTIRDALILKIPSVMSEGLLCHSCTRCCNNHCDRHVGRRLRGYCRHHRSSRVLADSDRWCVLQTERTATARAAEEQRRWN